jgi:ribosomal protein S18 acetylase RimI-like enzyme
MLLTSVRSVSILDRRLGVIIVQATVADAAAILDLQKLAYQSEARIYDDNKIPPLTQTASQIDKEFGNLVFLKATTDDGDIVGSVRAYERGGTCFIGRLIVHPDHQGRGIGARLMQEIESRFAHAERFELFTGHKSERNLRFYQRLGYRTFKEERVTDVLRLVFMWKESCSRSGSSSPTGREIPEIRTPEA